MIQAKYACPTAPQKPAMTSGKQLVTGPGVLCHEAGHGEGVTRGMRIVLACKTKRLRAVQLPLHTARLLLTTLPPATTTCFGVVSSPTSNIKNWKLCAFGL